MLLCPVFTSVITASSECGGGLGKAAATHMLTPQSSLLSLTLYVLWASHMGVGWGGALRLNGSHPTALAGLKVSRIGSGVSFLLYKLDMALLFLLIPEKT